MENKVVTRFAPSPTGFLHAGNYRTALFAYIVALQRKGKFILRIEDTDKARSKKEYEENVIDSLKWLGIKYDEFYRQSDRTDIHKAHIQKLIDSGHAYISKETPKNPGDREEVIRFKNPNKKVVFNDLIRGRIEFDTTELGDFIIARSMEEPVFHLVVVVDDALMGVTLIIRGEDHISNTPRHILIYEALGFPIPQYAHLPLLLSPDRTKLSKRKGALPMTAYRDKGYLPETLVNYMAFLGWNPGTEQEIMSFEEILSQFKLEKVQKAGAIFNEEKLNWMNREHLLKLPKDVISDEIENRLNKKYKVSEKLLEKLIPNILERIVKWSDVDDMVASGELDYYFNEPKVDSKMLSWKGKTEPEKIVKILGEIIKIFEKLPAEDFSKELAKQILWPFAEKEGKGEVLWPLRVALSGKEKSPDPFTLLEILGKNTSIMRINEAISILSK